MKKLLDLFGFVAYIIVAIALFCIGTSKAMAQVEGGYVPFVEEGKTWYCGYEHPYANLPLTPEDPEGEGIDCIFTMFGDTLVNGKDYKKVYCLFEEYYGDKEQHYYCGVREEARRVFIMEEKATEEKLIYDFSRPKEMITLNYDDYRFARSKGVHRHDFLPGQLEYNVYKFTEDGEVDYINDSSSWIDGVGDHLSYPFAFEFNFLTYGEHKFGKDITVRTCMKDGKYYYKEEWFASPVDPSMDDSIWGDLNNDGQVGISDVMDLINYILTGSRTP